MASPAPLISLNQLKSRCSGCGLRELCLPMGLSPDEVEQLDRLVSDRRRSARGETLYRAGDEFASLYAVRSGFLKTSVLAEDGREQVTGFHMAGEIIGLDGIGAGTHACSAIALEDSEVCVVPFAQLEELSRKIAGLQTQFHRLMSREIVRDHDMMMTLGSLRAEERLAAFLINLSQRFLARGYSPADFNLRMTREEIGSFLGLKLETVSRLFSKFQDERLVEVRQKRVRILDVQALRRVVGREC